MYDLSGFERDILYVLAGEDDGLKGLEIKRRLDGYYEGEIYDGRLYPAIDKLVDKGLVQKSKLNERTNIHELSQRGQREVAFRRRWENEVALTLFDDSAQTSQTE